MSDRHRPPGPITIWNRLLRGYGPFLVLALLALGMAVFVPSKVQEVDTAGGDGGEVLLPGSSDGTDGATPGATDGSASEATAGGATGGAEPGAGGADGPGVPAGVTACADRAEQIPGDPYSPPCTTFTGDNGGATHRGVTATEVRFSSRITQDASVDEALASIVGTDIIDTPADVKRTTQVLVKYFNSRFNFYGRKIVIEEYQGQGSIANELQGHGRDKAEVDATKVAESIKPFGDVNAFSEPYADALSRRGILNFGAPALSREWFTKRRPYAWSLIPDCSTLVDAATEYVVKRLSGGTATFAGGDLKGDERVITALAPENSWYQECMRSARRILQEAGTDWDVQPFTYKIDLGTMSNQAANLIPKLKSKGVTTILCGCDPIFPIFLSGTANREDYFPEFVSGYEQDFIGQLWDPEFQQHSFGISPLGPNQSQRPQSTVGYAAYKSIDPEGEPANGVDGLYYQLYMIAIGIQGAGPNLTPETFERGMFEYAEVLGPAGLWDFGPQDYTPMDDFHEFYWDPNKVSSYNGKKGAWVDPTPGKRYRSGADEMRPGPPPIPKR